jgi:hypothetical protein
MHIKADTTHLRFPIIMACVILVLVMPEIIPFVPAESSSNNQNVFTIDSKPYNLTYSEWTAKWWQWAFSTPKQVNPVLDEDGKNCAQGQSGPVWFLAGTFGGSVVRECTIPAEKSIMFPILNSECSYAEFPNLKTESELRDCAKTFQDQVTQIEATIDGVGLQGLEKYRVQSPLFNLTLPENNALGIQVLSTQAVSDGNWVFLKPLTPGKHEIHFRGSSVDFTTTSTNTFATETTYHLTVTP